jgi:hypothetical protein
MKKFAMFALIAAAALTVTPKSAFAGRNDDTAVAAIGGFIGGLVLGAALDNDHDRYDRYDRGTVVIGGGYRDRHYRDHDGGYWKTVTTKHWVPGYWTHTRDRRGRSIRVFVDGHWDYRTDRVWVSYDRHDRHDRRDGYGYDRGYRR